MSRNWFQRFFFKPSWEQAISECKSPKDVCKTVSKHISYREESNDKWFPAKETWKRGYGDCDDFAVLVQKMCLDIGFESQVQLYYSILSPGMGHAILVGKVGDGLWMASNGDYTALKSLDEVKIEVSYILFCKPSQLWNVCLSKEDVEKMIDKSI